MGASREDILCAAQRVLNVDATASISSIAEAAGVSRATMHRHFDSRESLLVELGTRSLDRWEQRLDAAGLEPVAASGDAARFRAAIEALVLGYVGDSADFGFALTDHVIVTNAALAERTDQLANRESTLFAAAQAAGVVRSGPPPRWFGHHICGLLVAGREAVRLGDVARRDVAHLVLSSFLTGASSS